MIASDARAPGPSIPQRSGRDDRKGESVLFTSSTMRGFIAVLLAFAFTACAERGEVAPSPEAAPEALESPQGAWWSRMMEHCGHAFEGGLTLAPEGDETLRDEDHLLVHFRECREGELRLPFHVEKEPGAWDRSRTWIFTRTDEGIHLDHDHRQPDGTPDEVTHYGGHTVDEGSSVRQVFIFTDYDGYDPAGPHRGWRVEIEPHARYTYGTFRGDDWRWRVDFDLSRPVASPPAPWGHE